MLKRFGLAGVVLAAATSAAASALAAQIIPIDFSTPDADGNVIASASFDWPEEGSRASVRIDFANLEVIDTTLTGAILGTATWWDAEIGGVTGNEYQLAFDCGLSAGCLSLASPTQLLGSIETPRGFDKPCTPATLGNCSFHYDPQFAVLDGYFRVLTAEGPFAATLAIGDFIAVPEPETWALLISGLGLAGAALRAKQRHGREGFASA